MSFQVDVFSVFGEIVEAITNASILGRAQSNGLLDVRLHDPRDHAVDVHRSVDDTPFGGGAGMVMRPEPLAASIRQAQTVGPVLAMSASGRRFDQAMAKELAAGPGFSVLCGRYEGIDQRIIDTFVDHEVSIGDYVLIGGEVAAGVLVESVGRLLPGVLGNADSATEESFSEPLLEYPHYTRPAEWEGQEVPDVLRSGDHGKVAAWRRAQSIARTVQRRPDLIAARGGLTDAERTLLETFNLA